MKYITNMPTWLANTIFVKIDKNGKREIDELSRTQIDIFFLLIFETSKSYDHDKNVPKILTYPYDQPFIEKTLDRDVSTLKSDMKKISSLKILTNIFESYGDNISYKYKPFTIKEVKSSKGIINYFVTVEENFIKQFTKPNPKFTLSYQYLTNLINPQAKLLYILLFNQLGNVSIGEDKNRNVELEMLLLILNKNPDKKNAQLQRDINKYIKSINEHTDIEVELNEDISKMDIDKDGNITEIVKKSFTIIRIKPYPEYIKVNKNSTNETKITEFRKQAEIKLEERKKDEKANKEKGVVRDDKAWLNKAVDNLMKEDKKQQDEQDKAEQQKQETLKLQEQRAEGELEKSKKLIDELLENEKDKLRDDIDVSKGIPYIIFQYTHKGLNDGIVKSYITIDYELWTEEEGQEGKIYYGNANKIYQELKEELSVSLISQISYTEENYDVLEKMYF